MNDREQGTGVGWLLAWLVFGVLAAREVGSLAMRAGGDWGALLSLGFLVASVASLSMLLRGATRSGRPSRAYAPIAFSVAGLLGCMWTLYGQPDAGSVPTAMFGAAYSTFCLAASAAGLALAWRRRHANAQRLAEAAQERERRRRLEGVRAETAALAAAAAAANSGQSDPLGPDDDFALPSRPKWEDS